MKRQRFNLENFLTRAKVIHGDKFNYDNIKKDDIKNGESKIHIKCNKCLYNLNITVTNHIHKKSGCPKCNKTLKWTLERFLKEAKEIHGNKYNYDYISGEYNINNKNKLHIKCNKCNHEWNTNINLHINKKIGCSNCKINKINIWTLENVIKIAKETHGDKFNYDNTKKDDIKNGYSRIQIKCNKCLHNWNATINNHIYNRTGCPNCSGNLKWTLEKFLKKAKEIHGNKYNYDNIYEKDIVNNKSKIKIKCNKCDYYWESSLISHIRQKTGCPDCAGNTQWTLQTFLKATEIIHGKQYDYSNITEEDLSSSYNKISIRCKKCLILWETRLNNHIHRKSGCPNCKKSKGEILCDNILKELKIDNIEYEYTPIELKKFNYKFDIKFIRNNEIWLLEFDGIQHFINKDFFDKKESLEYRQLKDRYKTLFVLHYPYKIHLIRIDYTIKDPNDIKIILKNSFINNDRLILSNKNLYENWLLNDITLDEYQLLKKSGKCKNNDIISEHKMLILLFEIIKKLYSSIEKEFNIKINKII